MLFLLISLNDIIFCLIITKSGFFVISGLYSVLFIFSNLRFIFLGFKLLLFSFCIFSSFFGSSGFGIFFNLLKQS